MTSNGMPELPFLRIEPLEGEERGVIAAEFVDESATLVMIPHDLLMNPYNLPSGHPIQGLIAQGKVNLFEGLLLHLLYEKQNKYSFWRTYIDILPNKYPLPIFWTKEERSLLEGTALGICVTEQLHNAEESFLALSEIVENSKIRLELNWDTYLWGLATIWSRGFDIAIDGVVVPILVPLGDLFNHHFSHPSDQFWDPHPQSFIITTLTPTERGEQIYISYGKELGNCKLLANYGFSLPHNPFSAATLAVDMSSLPLWSLPLVDVNNASLRQGRLQLPRPTAHTIPSTVLLFFRLSLLDAAAREEKKESILDGTDVWEIKGDMLALQQLQLACQRALSHAEQQLQATRVAEGVSSMSDATMKTRQYLQEEVAILETYLRLTAEMLPRFESVDASVVAAALP